MAGHARSTELQRLVEAGWAMPVDAERAFARVHRAPGAEHRGQL